MVYPYLITAFGLTPGGSSTVHIYTQTVHKTTQSTQTHTMNNTITLGRVLVVPCLCELYPGICLTAEENCMLSNRTADWRTVWLHISITITNFSAPPYLKTNWPVSQISCILCNQSAPQLLSFHDNSVASTRQFRSSARSVADTNRPIRLLHYCFTCCHFRSISIANEMRTNRLCTTRHNRWY
jgi:hypothetical protein